MEPNQVDNTSLPPIPPEPPVPPERPRRPRSVVGPIILILLGLAFLVNNLGLFNFNVWEAMWRLWPVWLIAVGLDMMLGRRTSWGSWVVLGIVVTVIAGAGWFYNAEYGYTGTVLETRNISADLQGVTRATVEIKPGVGELRLTATAPDDKLVEGTVNRLDGERIVQDYSGNNGSGSFTLRSDGVTVIPGMRVHSQDGTWNLRLNKSVPIDLQLGLGVGKSEIDLTGANLTNLDLNTGVGESMLTLPATGKFHVTMKSGIGKSTVRIPRGMAARIRAHNGIGKIDVNGDFSLQDGYYVSHDFASAANQVDVEINGGIGEVQVIAGY